MNLRKSRILIGALAFLLVLPAVMAFTVSASDGKEKFVTVSGTRFESSDEVTVNEVVENDLFAAAETIDVNTNVQDNAFLAGADILVDGDIFGNAFIGGARVLINNPVRGDLFIAGGYVVINADVEGDLRVTADQVHVNGDVLGDLQIGAGDLYLAETVEVAGEENIDAENIDRDVEVPVTNLNDADEYSWNNYNFGDMDFKAFDRAFTGFSVLWILGNALAALLTGYVALRLFPTFSEKVIKTAQEKPIESIVTAFLTWIAATVLSFVLLVSILGIELLLFLSLLASLALWLGWIYVTYVSGRFVLEKFGKENTGRFIVLLVGIILVDVGLGLLGLIPFLGWAITLLVKPLLSLLGVGAILYSKISAFQSGREVK